MDFGTNTEVGIPVNSKDMLAEMKTSKENVLLEILKGLCNETDSKLSPKLRAKVNRIVADCGLKYFSSLHKVATYTESTSTLLGFMRQTSLELTFEEQSELNTAFINKIEEELPIYISELENLKKTKDKCVKLRLDHCKELEERDRNLETLQEQEDEKMELMMEWLNHRISGVTMFSDNSSELLSLKTKILDMKSKILHLQILQNIFTETNQSIQAYTEVHNDLNNAIKDTEKRIKEFKGIENEFFK